jgi:hypothetical protein
MSDKKRCQSWSSTGVKFNLNEIERRARAATKGPWSRCTSNAGNCPCRTIWSTSLDDTPFCLAPSGPEAPVRIEDWDFVAALDPTTALALVVRIRILDEALSDAIAHVPAGEKRDQLVRVLSDMDSTGDIFARVDELAEERDAFRAMVVDLLTSAHPHPVEHPTMTAA